MYHLQAQDVGLKQLMEIKILLLNILIYQKTLHYCHHQKKIFVLEKFITKIYIIILQKDYKIVVMKN